MPTASAFMPKPEEDYLSVNWLEYFGKGNSTDAIEQVRKTFQSKNYQLKRGGRFAVLNISAAKKAALEADDCALCINHLPVGDDPSHAGIFGYTSKDLAIAATLALLVTPQDVHPAKDS